VISSPASSQSALIRISRLLVLTWLWVLLSAGLTLAADASQQLFTPIAPQPQASVSEWTGMGVPEQAAVDFVAYQRNPTKGNAVRAVRHYADIAGMNLNQRRTLFEHRTDRADFAKVFQSL
jgi:hypothetical protein